MGEELALPRIQAERLDGLPEAVFVLGDNPGRMLPPL